MALEVYLTVCGLQLLWMGSHLVAVPYLVDASSVMGVSVLACLPCSLCLGHKNGIFLSVKPIVRIFGLDSLAQFRPYMECYGGQW